MEKAWERPKREVNRAAEMADTSTAEQKRGTELLMSRLNRMIVPTLNFRDAPVQEAVAFLRRQSRELDQGPDSGGGINIVLEVPTTPPPSATPTGEEPGTAAPVAFSDKITLNLSNVPLYEAIRYVALQAGLAVKVEPFAVTLLPLDRIEESLEVREFKVPPGFITATAGAEGDSATFAGSEPDTSGGKKLSVRQGAKDFLESQGVDFPPGASARFTPGTSRLVIKNTPSNLNLVQALVEAALAEEPVQVEIEAKFVEISQNNLKELGFDWTLGPFSIGGSGIYGGGGSAAAGNYPFVNPGNTVVGETTATGGLRSGSGSGPGRAISVNSLNAILARSLGAAGNAAPGIFSVAGVFTNPQFQVVIRALNQKKGVDLMAAPKVTTKSGQKATISIVREFPYPQEFEPPQVPQNTGTGATSVSVLPGQQATEADPIVTPSFPTDFTTRNLGVTLEVEPQIGPDGYTIDMTLSPEVVDFDGFINYGSPIFSAANLSAAEGAIFNPLDPQGVFRPQLLTDNVINQPIFSTRKVSTSVSVWDGQTVAIGGLIREDIQKVNDKVPLLGDIPLAGALFRSEVEQKIKRNLIIFTTVRLMDAAGQPLRPEDDSDQEEMVEPLGLPPEVPLPARGNPKGLTRK